MQVTTGEEGFFGNGSSLVVYNPRDYPSDPNQYGSEWAQYVSMGCAAPGSPLPMTLPGLCLLTCCSRVTRARTVKKPQPQAALCRWDA